MKTVKEIDRNSKSYFFAKCKTWWGRFSYYPSTISSFVTKGSILWLTFTQVPEDLKPAFLIGLVVLVVLSLVLMVIDIKYIFEAENDYGARKNPVSMEILNEVKKK